MGLRCALEAPSSRKLNRHVIVRKSTLDTHMRLKRAIHDVTTHIGAFIVCGQLGAVQIAKSGIVGEGRRTLQWVGEAASSGDSSSRCLW